MYFEGNVYAKVWNVDVGQKQSKARITISRKANEKSYKPAVVNGYEILYQGFVKFIGTAHEMAKTLDCSNGGPMIKITQMFPRGGYPIVDKNGNKGYAPTEFCIYNFELADNSGSASSAKQNKQTPKKPQKQSYNNLPDGDEELPF